MAFRRFGPVVVDWPHKAESKSYFPPKGMYLVFPVIKAFLWELTKISHEQNIQYSFLEVDKTSHYFEKVISNYRMDCGSSVQFNISICFQSIFLEDSRRNFYQKQMVRLNSLV